MARKSRSAAAWGREEPSRTLPRRSAWPAVQIGNAVYWRRSEFELLEHVTVPINKVCSSMCSDVTSCVMCNERVPVEQGALADATLVSTRCSSPRAPTSSRGSTSGGARRWRWWWRCATAVAGCRSSLYARIWAAPAPRFDADLGSSRLISGHLAESRLHLHRAVDADRAGARTPVSAACELVQTQNVQHLTPQAHAAFSAACELAARHGGCGVVAGCDLNSIPGSGVHRLLTSGSLPHSHPHMAAVAAHSAALPLGTAPLHRRTAVNRPSSRSTETRGVNSVSSHPRL